MPRSRDDVVLLGVAVGLVLTVTLVVANTGRRGPVAPLARTPADPHATVDASEALEAPDSPDAGAAAGLRSRVASAGDADVGPLVDPARRREGRRREAACLAEFLALRAEQGDEAFERAVRDALASRREPLARRNAALRALHSADVPGTDAALAAAVEGEADTSDGSSVSLPRCALELLFERAASGEDARRALARLAFVQEARVSKDLRRAASTALCASLDGAAKDEAVRLLRLEARPQELERALEALARDPNFGGDRPPVAALGVPQRSEPARDE